MTGTCVVTGAGGFIGYRLANALATAGHDIVGVDVRFPDRHGAAGAARFVPVVADIRDHEAMRRALAGASVVFHLASAHLRVNQAESEYWDVNVHSLAGLLQLAQQAGVSRFVHTSSVGVYGDTGSTPATEATPPLPQSVYGVTKLEGEKAALTFGRERGLDVVVLRPAWVYGPGCARTERLFRALRTGRFVMIGDGGNWRHPIYIDDAIEAFRLAASVPEAAGGVFTIAGACPVTTRELVEVFCAALGCAPPRIRLPYSLGAALAATTEGVAGWMRREPPISRRTLEFFRVNNAFDTTRARLVLGFVPQHTLETGAAATRDRLQEISGARVCAA